MMTLEAPFGHRTLAPKNLCSTRTPTFNSTSM